MDDFVLIILLIVLAFLVLPIVSVVKSIAANRSIERLNYWLSDYEKLARQNATKEDINALKDEIQKLSDKLHTVSTENIVPINIEVTESLTPQPTTPIVEEIIEEEIAEEIPQPEEEPTVTEVIAEEIIEPETTEADVEAPVYAAFNNTRKEPHTTFSEVFQQPTTSQQIVEDAEDEEYEKGFIEKIFSENLLAKIGIVTLVLGIAFFVKYAIDQEWINEIGRVAIGVGTGAIIIAIAHKLKEKYHLFSSILVGGGISALYITITIAFREYEIFSQPIAFALLIAITIFSVILSLYYDRKELAIFSLLGGFASPLMISTGSGNYIVLFSYILILNTGMLVLAFRKNWHILGIISYVLTIIFFWSWLLSSFKDQYAGATLFASLFFVQFYALALADHFKGNHKISIYQGILILTNNLSLFAACMTIFSNYEYSVLGLVTIVIAVINAIVMVALFRKSEVDKNLIYLIIGVVMTFVNLAIPIQMDGYVITMFWAVEMAVLLWLWQRSQIELFRTAFLILIGLVLISYLMDVSNNYNNFAEPITIVFNSMFITGLVIIASFFASKFLLSKEDPESEITIFNIEVFSLNNCIRVINFLIIAFTYIVPFLELSYQVEARLEVEFSSSLRYMVLAAYTSVYVAILAFICRKEIANNKLIFVALSAFAVIYSLVYWYYVTDLRQDIYLYTDYPKVYFLLHFVAIIPLALVIYTLIRNIKSAIPENLNIFYWGMTVVVTLLIGIEAENISTMLFSNPDNYDGVLYDVRTFVFPVLWALIAMGLIIWGLKGKEVILRKISLIFFGVIIAKFYIYDVWHMSQAGRIVSFIMLGVIILLVSFLQQKIKVLIKDETSESENDQISN